MSIIRYGFKINTTSNCNKCFDNQTLQHIFKNLIAFAIYTYDYYIQLSDRYDVICAIYLICNYK